MKECPSCFGKGYVVIYRATTQRLGKVECPICHGEKYFNLSDDAKVKLIATKINELLILNGINQHCLCGRGEWCETCSPSSYRNTKIKALQEVEDFIKKLL